MFTPLETVVIAAKFLLPFTFLLNPLTIWLNYFLDIVDGDALMSLGMSDFTYQSIDKAADYVSYIFMLLMAWRWKIRNTVIVLFAYRTIGQFLFFLTRDEKMFFYFQNFLEPLLLIYVILIFKTKSETKAYALYQKHKIKIWSGVIVYKMVNEWYLHLANIDLSSIFLGFNGGS